MASSEKVLCDIYKSPKKDEMYLYVKKSDGLTRVPEALLERFGAPRHVTTLMLAPERKMARTSAEKVLAAIDSQGFFLQMPPVQEDYMQAINEKNSKLHLE